MNQTALLVIYYIAVVLTVSRNIAQLYKLIKLKLVYSVSLLSQWLYLSCTLIWVLYTILLWDEGGLLGVLITNLVAALLTIILIILIVFTKAKNRKSSDENVKREISPLEKQRTLINVGNLLKEKKVVLNKNEK